MLSLSMRFLLLLPPPSSACLLEPVSSSVSIFDSSEQDPFDSSEQDPFAVDYCFSLFTLQPWIWFHQ
jgi:hypothetical protein